jgi:hypothetical protein
VLLALEHGEPLDEIVYCEVMFTDEISGEVPEHRDFIYNVAIPYFESRGVKTTVLRSSKTAWVDFHTVISRGQNKGKLRGFPIAGMCAINRDCKVPPIRKYWQSMGGDVTQYVGIAIDEPERLERLKGSNMVSLLAKYGFTEAMAVELCKKYGLYSPVYKIAKRNGCFFCPNTNKKQLRHLYDNHPDIWQKLRELQATPNTVRRCFDRSKTVFEYEDMFRADDAQITIFDILEETK